MIGRTLPGGIKVLELVGVGGMGRVYRAEQKALGRTVAVKLIHPHLVGEESTAQRFNTEARAASRLNHPNSVSVIDFGTTDDGRLYLVMEFLQGRDLARVAYEEGPLPIRRILSILKQALAALSEAHHLGIVHRDLKPENIILEPLRSRGDFVKVVDFGLAKIRQSPQDPAITSPGIICGTPDYMAPEQGRGGAIDARTDLYAVGVILFQLLTGRVPFEAESPTQVVLMHLSIPPPDPRQIAPERAIPESLVRILNRSLAKEPDDRFATADEFSEALAVVQAEMDALPPTSHPPQGNCSSCGSPISRSQKFCAECGVRVSFPPSAPRPSIPFPSGMALSSIAPAFPGRLPLTLSGREEDLAWVNARRAELRGSLAGARIVGESGIGKTRLLRELLQAALDDGDVIVETTPDPWWAEVGYFALRRAIVALARLPVDGGDERDWSGASLEARRGLLEVFARVDALSSAISPEERRYMAAEALRWALGRASALAGRSRVILVVDDLHRIDGASRNAIADSLAEPPLVPVLILGAHVPSFDPRWPENAPSRILRGLSLATAKQLTRGISWTGDGEAEGTVLPFYVDQMLRFSGEGGTSPPSRLPDLIALRLERLGPAARRALQAMTVLGDEVDPDEVANLVAGASGPGKGSSGERISVQESIEVLIAAQMIERQATGLRHTHPLVREIGQASIPAAVRRELYLRAAAAADRQALPLEVRALYRFHAQDAFEALLLLEQVSARALTRGDMRGAVVALHRGLELARQELARGELEDPLQAVIVFSRKLGEALTLAGDLTDADGVLREALDLAGPSGKDRAQVLRALARVAHQRERSREAMGYLREAIEHATRSGSQELVDTLKDMQRAWAS
jgi:serine/threonine-protein kinase